MLLFLFLLWYNHSLPTPCTYKHFTHMHTFHIYTFHTNAHIISHIHITHMHHTYTSHHTQSHLHCTLTITPAWTTPPCWFCAAQTYSPASLRLTDPRLKVTPLEPTVRCEVSGTRSLVQATPYMLLPCA